MFRRMHNYGSTSQILPLKHRDMIMIMTNFGLKLDKVL